MLKLEGGGRPPSVRANKERVVGRAEKFVCPPPNDSGRTRRCRDWPNLSRKETQERRAPLRRGAEAQTGAARSPRTPRTPPVLHPAPSRRCAGLDPQGVRASPLRRWAAHGSGPRVRVGSRSSPARPPGAPAAASRSSPTPFPPLPRFSPPPVSRGPPAS